MISIYRIIIDKGLMAEMLYKVKSNNVIFLHSDKERIELVKLCWQEISMMYRCRRNLTESKIKLSNGRHVFSGTFFSSSNNGLPVFQLSFAVKNDMKTNICWCKKITIWHFSSRLQKHWMEIVDIKAFKTNEW